jgi:hypothetical protein
MHTANAARTRNRKTLRRSLAIISALLITLVATMVPAHADTRSGTSCGSHSGQSHTTVSEISHGAVAGLARVKSYAHVQDITCSFVTAAQHRAQLWLMMQSPSTGAYGFCTGTSMHYSSGNTMSFQVTQTYGSSPPCGDGFYLTAGRSAHQITSSFWLTVDRWSPSHGLPPCIEFNIC